MGVNYFKLAIKDERENEFNKLKENLTNLGVFKPTDDEVMAILLAKNKKAIMNEKEVKDIIKRLRGIG